MSGEGELKYVEKFDKSTVVLLDVAGTTSSICFVKDTLFPFVLNNVEKFLNDKWNDSDTQETVKLLAEIESAIVKEGEKDVIIKSLLSVIKELTEKNSEVEAFKKLQGLVYQHGYKSGELKGHVFGDVATCLPTWANEKRVCVYSSGSIESQKLLFSHSTEGDLSSHIAEYFDLAVGKKTEASSYKTIAEKLKCKAEDIIFLTDSVPEAKAALEVGLYSVLVSRDGNEELTADDKKQYPVIKSFSELVQEASGKRKITEEPEPEAPPAKVAKTEVEKKDEESTSQSAKPVEKPEESNEVEKMEVDVEPVTKVEISKENTETELVTSTCDEEPKVPVETKTTNEVSTNNDEKPTKLEEKPEEKEAEVAKEVPSEIKPAEDNPVAETLPDSKKEAENKTETQEATTSEKPVTEEVKSSKDKETEPPKTDTTETIPDTSTDAESKEPETVESKVDEKSSEAEKVTEKENPNETKPETKVAEVAQKAEEQVAEEKKETEVKKEVKEATSSEAEKAKEEPIKKETLPAEGKTEKTVVADEIQDEKVSEGKNEEGEKKAEASTDAVTDTKEEPSKKVDVVENGASTAAEPEKGAGGDAETKETPVEKENKSELANGAHIENGEEGCGGDASTTESEIKVKKIEAESEDSEKVSVEVKA